MPKEIAGTARTEALRQMLLDAREQVLKEVERLLARRRMAQAEQRDDSVPGTTLSRTSPIWPFKTRPKSSKSR